MSQTKVKKLIIIPNVLVPFSELTFFFFGWESSENNEN